MKSKLTISFIFVLLSLLIGHTSQAQKNKRGKGEEERINPKFSYSPQTREAVASTEITIALLNPVFLNDDIKKMGSPFTDFAKAMSSDVEELLTAKGFKVRGPFNSIDEMVVSDKSNSDFIIQIFIDLEPSTVRKWK